MHVPVSDIQTMLTMHRLATTTALSVDFVSTAFFFVTVGNVKMAPEVRRDALMLQSWWIHSVKAQCKHVTGDEHTGALLDTGQAVAVRLASHA